MSKHKHKHKEPKMSSLEEMEALYTAQDGFITPVNNNYHSKNNPAAWKYYLKIREKLPEWWEKFNGDLDKYGRLKYSTISKFIYSRTNAPVEQRWLKEMLGPANKETQDKNVPWLGDWEKRRSCGFGMLDDPKKFKPLIKAIHENLAAVDSVKSMAPILTEELVQYSNLQRQVHEAFVGQAFRDGKPDSKENIARFKAYKSMLWSLSVLKINIISEVMRVYGINPKTPEMMRDIAQIAGGVGAAAALTGIAAGQRIPGLGAAVPSPDGSTAIAPFTYDAFKMAEHLTRHAHVFRKPLPVIDAEDAEYKKETSHKGNGKVV